MKNRTPISLFPFLSVLVSTMGTLSLLAVTFSLFAGSDAAKGREVPRKVVDVRWTGAPAYVRPLLVECRADGILFHSEADKPPRFFPADALRREVQVVKMLQEQGMQGAGPFLSRQQIWLYFKSVIDKENRLARSFTQAVHHVELSNLVGENRRRQLQFYPILLVYPDGVATYDMASFLVETTTRLSLGVEPMLPGWNLPYRRQQL